MPKILFGWQNGYECIFSCTVILLILYLKFILILHKRFILLYFSINSYFKDTLKLSFEIIIYVIVFIIVNFSYIFFHILTAIFNIGYN